MCRLGVVVCFALASSFAAEDVIDALANDDQCDGSESCALNALQTHVEQRVPALAEEDVVEEQDYAASDAWMNRHLQDAKRDLDQAIRHTNHMMGEMDQQQVVRLLDRSIKQTRYVHKCDSMMHEARMHMKDARMELRSLGRKSNNKRMAENHMHKARKKMNHCQGFMLVEEDEQQLQQQPDVNEFIEVEGDASEEEDSAAFNEWMNKHLEDAKRDLDNAIRRTNHMMGEMDQQQVVRLLERSIKQTRDVHKCDSMMHEARMHMNDAKTELRSLGKKSNNKRMAENHMHKARKKMNHCNGAMLVEENEQEEDEQEPEVNALLEVEGDASDNEEAATFDEWMDRHLEDAKRDLDKALRDTNHMMGEMDQQQVVRLLERAIKQTRYVHKCESMMHEARMHMKDAKTELRSLGKKSNNKRMAENHMHKARKKMNHCNGAMLLEEDEQHASEDTLAAEEHGFTTSGEETGCKIEQQGSDCQHDSDCDGHFACCQDTVAKKIGVKPCRECTKTCHPTTHKCKCN